MALQEEVLIESARLSDIDGVKAALAAGANVHAGDDAALRWAALNGHAEMVSRLLAAGANVHADHDDALRWSAYYGHAEMVNLLLVAGANIHANNDQALYWAAIGHHDTTVCLLLAAGAGPAVALQNAPKNARNHVVTMLDAHAAALTSKQRTALLAVSRPGELVQLRAIAASTEKRSAVRR